MLKLFLPMRADDTLKADLDQMEAHLGRLLPLLLIGRFPAEVLRRWAYLRCCVGSAQEGDFIASLDTIGCAVDDLCRVISRRFGPRVAG